MEVYKSNYQTIVYFEDKKMLRKEWTILTEDMEDDVFQSEVVKIAETAERCKPLRMCDVTTNFFYPITPELQKWVDTEIFPRFIKAGLMRYALVISKEAIAQMSIEQTMEESQAQQFSVQYFDNEQKAKDWLMK